MPHPPRGGAVAARPRVLLQVPLVQLLTSAAKDTDGSAFGRAAANLSTAEKEKLALAWPIMRAGQQLAAHDRTTQALKETEALRQSQRQSQALK